jgi:hypothetical protein
MPCLQPSRLASIFGCTCPTLCARPLHTCTPYDPCCSMPYRTTAAFRLEVNLKALLSSTCLPPRHLFECLCERDHLRLWPWLRGAQTRALQLFLKNTSTVAQVRGLLDVIVVRLEASKRCGCFCSFVFSMRIYASLQAHDMDMVGFDCAARLSVSASHCIRWFAGLAILPVLTRQATHVTSVPQVWNCMVHSGKAH